jgi:hypothetical protein
MGAQRIRARETSLTATRRAYPAAPPVDQSR